MAEVMKTPIQSTPLDTMMEVNTVSDEHIMLKMMEQNLEGVMFHLFEVDLFDLLDLSGFKAMHKHQYKEEESNLEFLKHKYIKECEKFPMLKTGKTDFWESNADLYGTFSHEKVSELVKTSMKHYADWETEVLEHLLKWKRSAEDRKIIHCMIEDVMKELKQIETLIDILEEHNYNYECICELSDYLYRKF